MNRPGTRDSLQWRLSVGLIAVILFTGAVAGALSFVWAWHDANEILDGTLEDTAALIAAGQMSVPQRPAHLPGSEPDNDVLVIPIDQGAGTGQAGVPAVLAGLGEGFHTVDWQGRSWRVLVQRLAAGERLAIAQRTEVRDEIAQHSALRTLFPLLVLIPLLILFVRQVVKRTLGPVARLARHVDTHAMGPAARLPEVEVPLEIQPFVHSIKRLLGELTAALEHQQRFVANAAHELRSPMAALQLQAANVERVLPDDEARRRLAELQRGIARMRHLLEQLLSMARAEATGNESLRPVRLADVAREVIAELVLSADAKGVDLGMGRSEPDVCILATPMDLRTLLHNVVENAVKYGPAGSQVTLSIHAEGPDAVLLVEDNGPGIADEHLHRVFEPFYRGSAASKTGTGLGLSIVAAIASRLGGRVSLSTASGGRGVRFEYRQKACAAGASG